MGDECVYIESGAATVETVFGSLSARQGDYVLLPRATTHRWLPQGGEPLRAYAIEANSHITPARRYLSKFGQLLEHAPYCERDIHGPGEPLVVEATDVEVYIKHRGSGPSGIAGSIHVVPEHPFDVVGWDGCLYPYTFNVERLQADHRPGAPAAAGAPGLRGQQLRRLQLRAAQGRLPPAVDPGALLPLQRRLRRGDVLLRRRLRGAQGIGHRARLDQRCTPAATRTGRSPGPTRLHRRDYFDELAVMVDTFRPLAWARVGRPATTAPTRWSWAEERDRS